VRFYISRGGNSEGPLDEQVILAMIARRELDRQAYICAEGAQAWQALDSHPPFATALAGPAPQPQAFAPQPQAFQQPHPQAFAQPQQPQSFGQPQPQSFGQPQQQAFGQPQQQAFGQPQPQAFGQPQQPSFSSQANQAAGQASKELNNAANAFGNAFGSPAAAPGQGMFEQAKAQGQPIPDSAKAAAGNAHLFAALGVILACGPWGGWLGAVASYFLYKDQPKHPFALYHINQAMVFHAASAVLMITLGGVVNIIIRIAVNIADILGLIASGLYLLPLAVWIGVIVLSFGQRTKSMNGEWSEYPKAGKFVMGRAKPFLS
jgi:hypothetical protein